MQRTILTGLLASASVALAGCVNLDDVKSFSGDVETLVAQTDDFYSTSYELWTDLKASQADDTGESWHSLTEGDLHQGADDATAVPKVLADHRKVRTELDALAGYAAALNALATLDQDSAIEAAAKDFGEAYKSFGEKIGADASLPDSQGLTGLITAIGQAYVDVRKRSEVRKAVLKASGPVKVLLGKLREDVRATRRYHELNENQAAGMREKAFNRMRVDAGTTAPADDAAAAKAPKPGCAAGLSLLAARALVREQLVAHAERLAIDDVIKSFDGAIDACAAAHEELGKDTGDLRHLVALKRHVTAIRAALDKLDD